MDGLFAESTPAAAPPVDIGGAELERRLRAGGAALVQVWAPWCIYSLLHTPRVELLARRLSGRVPIFRLSIDTDAETARRLRIRWIPALALFDAGRLVRCWYGADPEPCQVERTIYTHLLQEDRHG